ncbi:MAG: site-2 protease family protein [Synergistaceae bacterium]|jgi:Zn-dependent protease|nr:site-2 protease family protein [Synergistaceae bacterium]
MNIIGNMFSADGLADLLLRLPAVLWAISFHEFCHGWVAYKLGDRTAAMQGRLSLNPLAHIDPIGAVMLILFQFGWARPVPINSRNFRNPRKGIVLVSLAGAGGNFLTVIVCALLIKIFPRLLAPDAMGKLMINMLAVNIGLGVFNLIPIPPLDGSKVLGMMLPPRMMRTYFFLENYGMWIILALVFTGILQLIMTPIINFIWNFIWMRVVLSLF